MNMNSIMSTKRKPSDFKLWKEMCDLMFEIAFDDDDDENKSTYLNDCINKWKYLNSVK